MRSIGVAGQAQPRKYLLLVLLAVGVVGVGTKDQSKLMTIGLVADNHYDTFPAGEKAPWESMAHWLQGQVHRTTTVSKRRYDVAKDKMDEAVDVFNMIPEMSLVVNLGDLVNNDLMWNLRPILDSFNRAKAPHFSLLGNHDLRAHNDRFGKVNKTQEEWIRAKLGLTTWHYSLDHAPFKLIFLDSMVMEPENTNQTKKQELMQWLKDELQVAAEQQRAVILFAHIPIGFQTNVLGPILRSYPHIVAAFFGHDHKGGYIRQDNTHCVTMQGQIETLVNSFAIVEVFVDRVELSGFGRVPSRVMPFAPQTIALIKNYSGPAAHDLALQGNQPLPPDSLWENEVLQKPPPLQLNIPGYKKPLLPPSEPNPGDTLFLKKTYPSWPRRVRTPSPEDPVQLNDAVAGAKPIILSAEAAVGTAAIAHTQLDDDDGALPAVNRADLEPPTKKATRRIDTEAELSDSPLLASHFAVFVSLPVLIVLGGTAVVLCSRRRRRPVLGPYQQPTPSLLPNIADVAV